MSKEKSILRQIAETYGKDVKTITRHIKAHPELEIVLEERKAPTLTEEQVQGLCAILDKQYKQPEAMNEALRRHISMSQTSTENDADSNSEVAALKAQIAQLKIDLEVEKARTEELRSRVEFAEQQVPKLLEESTDKSKQIESLRADVYAAKEEAGAAREEWKSKSLIDRLLKR